MNWSIEELKTLRENYQSNAKELSEDLESRSAQAIRTKACELGLSEEQEGE